MAERERTIAVLSDRFAQGEIELEEFEDRVTLAHRAASREELATLIADLSVTATSEPSATQGLDIASDAPERGEAVAVFGGTSRDGVWSVPKQLGVTAVFGGIELDFRKARLPAGPVELQVNATFGGVQVIVPPNLAVEVHGTAIFGGFDHMDRASPEPEPGLPVLRIRGRAIFGGVSVETRLPGESQREAHRRRRRSNRQLGRHRPND